MSVTLRFDKELPVDEWLTLYRAAEYNAWWTERNAEAALTYAYMVSTAWSSTLVIATLSVWSDGVNFAWIDDLVVHPGHRDRGIGSSLVSETVSRIRQNGIVAVQVLALPGRQNFFRRLGFVEQQGMVVMDLLTHEG